MSALVRALAKTNPRLAQKVATVLGAKNVGLLYHLVGFDQLTHIISTSTLSARNFFDGISTTRDKQLNRYTGGPPVIFFKLELDGDKLAERIKITPVQFKSLTDVEFKGEHEELIKAIKIPNIWKYVTKFIFIRANIEKDYKYVSDISDQFSAKWLPRVPVPFYVQEGSQIKKDNEFLREYHFIR